mgnify:FL=1
MSVARYAKVGIFFIAIGIAGAAYMIQTSDGYTRFNTHDYAVILDDASGLAVNSRIFLAGVPVGKIRAIGLEEGKARVTVAFLRDVPIRAGASITSRSSSLLGTSVLVLVPGDASGAEIPPGGRIDAGSAAVDLASVASSVQDMSARLAVLLEESLGSIGSIAKRVDERSERDLDRVSAILDSTARLTDRLDRILAAREGELGSSSADLAAALANLREITADIRDGRGAIGRVVTDDELYVKLRDTVDSANDLVRNANDIVGKASGLGVQVDTVGRYDVIAATARASASIRLTPSSGDRWYRVGVSSAPDGIVTRKTTDTSEAGNPTTHVETSETKSGFTIDAEIARRVGPVTLRGGLLESTAGLGLDFEPSRKLAISSELFDFSATARPNLRETVTVYPFFDPRSELPWNWLYFRAGLTSALESDRDWFVGLGFRFEDEYIRGLVGLVPTGSK